LFLWYWDKTKEARTIGQWVVLGLITGLMLNVYYANLMIVTVLLAEAVRRYAVLLRSPEQGLSQAGELLKQHLIFGLVVCVSLLPTFMTRWVV
ncbi:hypothetical protein ACKI1Z_41355, partial [Streptomyces galilaeus]|uniref:hypothetical protein n=1 Tax=Streptomyces galilaeus TaxID=33899 RepID=UPI0038F7C426